MLSVVIPCYNNGELLIKLLTCCKNQTYKDFEIIIIDDCSTDDTFEIISDYIKDDSRMKIFVRDRLPKGGDTCRNIGLDKAKGEYIIFFDADDLISNTCFEIRVAEINKYNDYDYISFPAKSFIDENCLPNYYTKGKTWGCGKVKNDLKSLLTADYSFAVWCNIYKTEVLRKYNIRWDENVFVYQDFDFMFSGVISNLKHKYSDSKQIDYFYRIAEGSVSSNFVSDQKCESTIYLFTKVLNEFFEKKLDLEIEYFKKFIELHFDRLCKDNTEYKIIKYLEMVEKYYGKEYVEKLFKIYSKMIYWNKYIDIPYALLFAKNQYRAIFKLFVKKILKYRR